MSRPMELVAYSDQGGRPDGVQVMVCDGYAYVGHLVSNGFSVLDVRDPRNPRAVGFVPAPPNMWSLHLQAADGLLLVVNALTVSVDDSEYYKQSLTASAGQSSPVAGGMRVYDISTPGQPQEIGFLPVDGVGIHRIWYSGGRYAYVSASLAGFDDYILMVVDMQDPAHPVPVGRWWPDGLHRAAGETPSWPEGRRVAHHHSIVAGDVAYGAWRDGGFTLVDVSEPQQPTLISQMNLSPPFGGGTHTTLPLADRNLLIVADEATDDNYGDGPKYVWVVDVRDKSNLVTISTFPTPSERDYTASVGAVPEGLTARFGPHNLHENRPGSFQSSELIFATYQSAGVRAFDIRDPFRPVEVGHFVPEIPSGSSASVPQSCDLFVTEEGLVYLTDFHIGLHIVEFTG